MVPQGLVLVPTSFLFQNNEIDSSSSNPSLSHEYHGTRTNTVRSHQVRVIDKLCRIYHCTPRRPKPKRYRMVGYWEFGNTEFEGLKIESREENIRAQQIPPSRGSENKRTVV